jgi:hypothetical protein
MYHVSRRTLYATMQGKRFRPMVVLLMAGATNPSMADLTTQSAVSNVRGMRMTAPRGITMPLCAAAGLCCGVDGGPP